MIIVTIIITQKVEAFLSASVGVFTGALWERALSQLAAAWFPHYLTFSTPRRAGCFHWWRGVSQRTRKRPAALLIS